MKRNNNFSYLTGVLSLALVLLLLASQARADESPGIANLEELLSTVPSSELGFPLLSIDKMRATMIGNSTIMPQATAQGLTQWIGYVENSTAQDYVNTLVNRWNAGELGVLRLEHSVELFNVSSIYSNAGSTVNRTRVTITVLSDLDATGVRVLEFIPKEFAASASEIIFPLNDEQIRVLEQDPLLEWSIPLIRKGERRSFTYYLQSTASNEGFKTMGVYELPVPETPEGQWVEEKLPEEGAQPGQETGPKSEAGTTGETEPTGTEQSATPPEKPSWFIPIIISVIILEAGLTFIILGKRKPAAKAQTIPEEEKRPEPKPEPKDLAIRPDLVIPYEKVRHVEKFIESQLRKGKSTTEIKHELISVGWDEHVVEVILHDVHTVDKKIDKVDKFVLENINKGMPIDEIRKTLVNIGWREDLVDLVLDDFK